MIFGYQRVSTIDQASSEKTSLAEQERKIRGFGAMQMDEPEVAIFSDPGVSGSVPLDQRPSGIRMLAALKAGDTICAAKLDRIFRSASDALQSVDAFHKQGINVVLLDVSSEPIASSGVGKMFFTILASVAEFERWRLLERMNDGRNAKLAKGGYAGGHAPYGWKAIGRGSNAILAEHENEQKVVQLITGLKTDGQRSLHQIATELERRGLKNRVGGRFAPEQIKRIVGRSVSKIAAE